MKEIERFTSDSGESASPGSVLARPVESQGTASGMDDATRREVLWKTLARFDHYISTMNNKAGVVAAFNAFVVGAIVLKAAEVLRSFQNSPPTHHFALAAIVLIALSSALSLFFSLRTLAPFLDPGGGPRSLIFFGHIGRLTPDAFVAAVRAETDAELLDDLGRQVSAVAVGLTKKSSHMRYAIWAVDAQLLSLVVLCLLSICAGS